MSYNFRLGTELDIHHFRKLQLDSYSQYKEVLGSQEWEKMSDRIMNNGAHERFLEIGTCFVATKEDTIVGMSYFIPSGNPDGIFPKEFSYIRLVAVHPDHEGNGLGRKLTLMCIDKARESGESVVALHTSEFQNAARNIYESMGFRVLKEIERAWNKTFWMYVLDLKPMRTVNKHIVSAYTWAPGCKSFELFDNQKLSVKEETMQPGTFEKLHFHEFATQFFYILKGKAVFVLDEERLGVLAGEGIPVAPGAHHQIINEGTEPLEFLVISEPSTIKDRVNV